MRAKKHSCAGSYKEFFGMVLVRDRQVASSYLLAMTVLCSKMWVTNNQHCTGSPSEAEGSKELKRSRKVMKNETKSQGTNSPECPARPVDERSGGWKDKKKETPNPKSPFKIYCLND